MTTLFKKSFLLTTIGIALVTSFFGAIFLLAFNFDGIEFNGDSHVYFLNAQHFSASLSNHHFPKATYWPYGYPALLSLSFNIGEETFETARWVNILAGGLLSAGFCLIALLIAEIKKFTREETIYLVLITGLLPLGHGLFLKYQITMMSDMVSALLNVLTIYFCWKSIQTQRLYFYLITGIILGLSVSTRYSNALMVIPVGTILWYSGGLKNFISIKKTFAFIIFGTSALLIFSPQLYITLQDTSSSLGNGLLNGWNLKNFITLHHESIDGSQTAKIPSLLYYLALPFRWQCFTPFGIILVVLGIKYCFHELPKWLSYSMVTWYAAHYILLCGIPLQNSRIGFPLFLPIVIWLTLGIVECSIKWKEQFSKIITGVAGAWILSLVISCYSIFNFIQTKNNLQDTAKSAVAQLPINSRIISTSLFAVYRAYPEKIEALSIYAMPLEKVKELFPSDKPTFLAIDEKNFIPQWSAYPPGKCYQWIKKHYSCVERCKINDYTVYEVKPKYTP